MKSIQEANLEGKKVFLRADYNVPVEKGEITEDERIVTSVDTVKFIFQQKPSFFMIVSHLGRPEGKREEASCLGPVADKLQELIGIEVVLISDISELEPLLENPTPERIYMLENIRFWEGEEAGDEEFAKKLAAGFDVYVNDAFSVSHRPHASVSLVPKNIPEKYAGLLLEKEYTELSQAKDNPVRPAVGIIGGAKLETKLPVIKNLNNIFDKVLVGGMIANEALDEGLSEEEKVLLPTDFGPEGRESERLDIGPKTIQAFVKEIESARTIIWNGPLGKFEEDGCGRGTEQVLQAIVANKNAHRIVGGGETIEALEKFGRMQDFDYVSMSGGAMLEFLAGVELPGLKALE